MMKRCLIWCLLALSVAGTTGYVADGADAAGGPPMVRYWNEGVREDAIQWCEVHAYIQGVRVYGCIYNQPSCAWAGVPYAPTRGTCSMAWTMWPRIGQHNAKYCIGGAHYVYTRNATTFHVNCYPLRWI